MASASSRTADVEAFILQHVPKHPGDIARVAAEHFGISRQAVNRHLKRLIDEGKLVATGATRNRQYAPAPLVVEVFELQVTPKLAEDVVWTERVGPLLRGLPKNVEEICYHGFTEMLNNVIDHSGSPTVEVLITRSTAEVVMGIVDRGVGIFRKIARDLALEDERHAILELSKGKLTTDPTRHSGEGIFFTSQMFDEFALVSGTLCLLCDHGKSWLLDKKKPVFSGQANVYTDEGTVVRMMISVFSPRTLVEVFDRYSDKDEDYGFTRTRVPVALARHGSENLVSRSQAKRLLARFDRFKEVLLDFAGVEMIGQAFADEIFRVFRKQHPDVQITWAHAGPDVEKMIRRARSAGREQA